MANFPSDRTFVDQGRQVMPAWLNLLNGLAKRSAAIALSAETFPMTTIDELSEALERIETKVNAIIATEVAVDKREP